MNINRHLCPKCNKLIVVTSKSTLTVHGPRHSRCSGSGSNILKSNADASLFTNNTSTPVGKIGKVAIPTRIKRGKVRHLSISLADTIEAVCKNQSSTDKWENLLSWAASHLATPMLSNTSPSGPRNNTLSKWTLSKALPKKVEAGDLRGAIRLVEDGGPILNATEDLANAMRQKHPARLTTDLTANEQQTAAPIVASREDVLLAIKSFSWASAGGPDGLRPSHLKQLTGKEALDGAELLLSSLLNFTNLCLAGHVPRLIQPKFFGCRLLAFQKPDGGSRPIAIGNTLRRLIAKIACKSVCASAVEALAQIQLGVGVRGGAEVAVHAARSFLSTMSTSEGLAKLDFSNAFNCVSQDAVLKSVAELVPSLLPFVICSYSQPAILQFGDWTLNSCEGVQQGDPLGPMVFSLAIKHISHRCASSLRVWYLDDCSLAGKACQVAEDVKRIALLS